MTEALVVQQPKEMIVTQEQMTIARNTVAKGLSNDEFAVYLYNCQRQSIHPLDGLLVPISRNDSESGGKRLTFVSTVDLLRSRAADTGDYAGNEDPLFENIDGVKNPQSATVTVWKFVRGEKCQFTATARWGEYYPGEGKAGFMWRAKPHVMLGKCAEALALRKAFPKQLAGLYVAEELEQGEPSTEKPRREEEPMPSVKCSECNAEGGHLPSCSKRKPAESKPADVKKAADVKPPANPPAPKAEGPVICSECRQTNGHKPDCFYAKAAEPAKQEKKAEPAKAEQKAPPALCKVTAVVQKQKKQTEAQKKKNEPGAPYLVLDAMAQDGTAGKMYVWKTDLHEYFVGKQNFMLVCEVSKQETADKKVFFQLEHIVELAGEKFVDDKPVNAQPVAQSSDEEIENLFAE